MTDQGTAAAPPAEKKKPALPRWASVIIGLGAIGFGGVQLIGGGGKLIDQFTLPSCTSDRTKQTIQSIFKSKDVELTDVSDMKPVTDTSSEKTCTARIESAEETANIDYKIYWSGWSAQVLVATVHDEKKK